MTNSEKQLINNFKSLVGAKFITVNEYLSKKSGEVSNHTILANFDYSKAVAKDINKLETLSVLKLQEIANNLNIDIAIVTKGFNELLNAFLKNRNEATRSNQSIVQDEKYLSICPSVRLNKDTLNLHVYGLSIQKTVLVKGEYKHVNSADKTIAKNAIKKALNFSTAKFRNFVVTKEQLKSINSRKEAIMIK